MRLLLLWLALTGLGLAQPGWDPQKTWVFTVGILEWRRSDAWAPFPKQNRRDLRWVQAWRNLGVPPDHLVQLFDQQATAQAIQSELGRVLGRTAPGDTLVIYYAGHGYREEPDRTFWMVPYDGFEANTLWGLRDLARRLEQEFKGSRLVLAADCCHSGSLRWLARNWKAKSTMYALSSSTARLPSTGNWTFTDCLLDALAGDPRCDHNGDGWISEAEVAAQVERDMLFAEAQRAGGSASEGAPNWNWVQSRRSAAVGEGEFVDVLYADGKIYKARVLERGDRGVLVHWMGLPDDYPDEWMNPRSIRSGRETIALPPPQPAPEDAW